MLPGLGYCFCVPVQLLFWMCVIPLSGIAMRSDCRSNSSGDRRGHSPISCMCCSQRKARRPSIHVTSQKLMLDSTFGFENIYYIIPTILKGLSSRRKKKTPFLLFAPAILFVPFTPPANSLLHSNLVPCCKVYICSIRGHASTRSETNLSPPIPTTFSSTIIQPYSFSCSSLNWYGPYYWLIVQRENPFFLSHRTSASDYIYSITDQTDRQGYKRSYR